MAASTVDAHASPAANIARPPLTTTVVPIRSTMRGPSVLPSAIETRHRQQPDTGLECAVALDELEVLGDDEDEAEQSEEACGDGEASAREPAVGEHRHVEHRMRAATLPHREGDQHDRGEARTR